MVLAQPTRTPSSADNITEVIIARVAQRGGFGIAGKEEFRARLGVESDQRAQVRLDDLGCLGRAAVSLGVRRIVAGSIGTRGKQYLFSLNVNNVETGRIRRTGLPPRRGRRRGSDPRRAGRQRRAFKPRVEPGKIQVETEPAGARVSIDNAYLGGHAPHLGDAARRQAQRPRRGRPRASRGRRRSRSARGRSCRSSSSPDNLPVRRSWPPTVAYGTAGLAVAAAAAGGFLGVLSQLQPTGATRADAQEDFDQKRRFALAANVSFGAGAVLGAVSLFYFIHYRDDIFGRAERYDEAPEARLSGRPAVGHRRDVRSAP